MTHLARSCHEDGGRYRQELGSTKQSLSNALESLVVDSLGKGGYTRQISPDHLEVVVIDLPRIDLFTWTGCLYEMRPLITVASFVADAESVSFDQSVTALYLEESVVQSYVALAKASGVEERVRAAHLCSALLGLSAGGLNCVSSPAFKRALNLRLRDLITVVLLSAETERTFLEVCDQLEL